MEDSMDETKAHPSFRSPPRRRRSSFFERKESIVPSTTSEIVNPNKIKSDVNESRSDDTTRYQKLLGEKETCKKEVKIEQQNKNDDLRQYYQKLLAEKEMWKKEVNERKEKYDDLRQQYKLAVKSPNRFMSFSALSNEDIEFLKGKPNISKLVDSQQKLHKSVLEAKALYRRANELDEVILNKCKNVVSMVTAYVIDNSTVAPKE